MSAREIAEINAALDRLRNASTADAKTAARNVAVQLGTKIALDLPPEADTKAFCDGLTHDINDAFAS